MSTSNCVFQAISESKMAFTAAAGVVSLLVMQFRILTISAECLDTDSEEYQNMNARMDILTWKIQDFVTYQTKFRNLERKVLVREHTSKNLERRLKATEAELGVVKTELGRRQREVVSGALISEPVEGSNDSLDLEELLLRERVERQAQEAKLQTTVESLMQADQDVLQQLSIATDNVQQIQSKVSDLEAGNMQLGAELDDVRRLLELVANSSDERKGPPLTAEQSRTKLNEFLKDVEELNLFEAAANHSHLMVGVERLSQGLEQLTKVTESTRHEVGTLSLNSQELLTKISRLRGDIDSIREVVEKLKPWEGYTVQEIGTLEVKLTTEIKNLNNTAEQVCKGEVFGLKEKIENVSLSLLQLRSEFEENEASRNKEQQFRKDFLKNIDQAVLGKGTSDSIPEESISFQFPTRTSSNSESSTSSERSSAVTNIRRLSTNP